MSPKNKGKFGKGKPAIEPQDEFVSGVQRVAERLRPHATKIFVFLGVVLAGVGGTSIHSCYKWRRATKASTAYNDAVVASRRQVKAPPPAPDGDAGVAAPEGPDELQGLDTTFASEEERQEAVLGALSRIQGSARIAGPSKLIQAASLMQLGRYDDALAIYRAFSGAPALQQLAREGVGYALEAKALAEKDATAREAGLREALAAFTDIETQQGQPGYDLSLWHQARLHDELGEKDQAVALLDKLRALDPPSPLAGQAEDRLALLQARRVATGAPAPTAPPPAPAPAPTPPGGAATGNP